MIKQIKHKFKKILIFSIYLIFLLETISYVLIKFDNTEMFIINSFTEKTNDKRIYTLKKNYFSLETIIDGINDKNWKIFTSNDGFRIEENYTIDSTKEKFLFIGDSVPFGWGVNYNETVPYFFQKKNLDLTVLNGAVPSYSLNQAVERFFIEFSQLENLKYLYLQVYAPAQIYAHFGTDWRPGDNWTTISKYILRNYEFLNVKIPFYGEPYTTSFIKKKVYRIQRKRLVEIKTSNESDKKYIDYLNKDLIRLNTFLNKKKIKLILSPINAPDSTTQTFNDQYKNSIILTNDTFKKFSNKNENVIFFDISKKLNSNDENFIDQCCHLSKAGAILIADELNFFFR
jgi:hypothetical protein